VKLPLCIGCGELLTIKHILLTCSDFIGIRQSHFTAQSLDELFQEIAPEKIFNFLKEINICKKNIKLQIIFGYVCVLLPFLSRILKLYIYQF